MDTNQDKSRERSDSNDSSNSAEQPVLTTPIKCDNEQDAMETEDSCSQADNKTCAEELAVDETCKVSQPEASEEVKDKYERNLKKFLKATETLNEIRSRMKTEVSEKVKSDGELSKITDSFGKMSKISPVLKISLRPSSAPPTFSPVSGQIPQNVRLSITPDKSESDTSNVVSETNKIASIPESLKPSVSGKTENNSSEVKVLDSSQGKSSGEFKLPTLPTMLDETSKNASPEMSEIKERAITPPVVRRRKRTTFSTCYRNVRVVRRRCQSLPNMKRNPPPELVKERSNRALRSGVVRSLFRDEPGPSTSEGEPTSANINATGVSNASSRDKSKNLSQEESSLPEVSRTSSQLDIKPKMCRKLVFALPSPVETEKAESAVEATNAPKEKAESPVKRKEVSSDIAERSSVKKARKALDFNRSDKDTSEENIESINPASEEVAKDHPKPTSSSGKKMSPVKRKAEEMDEESSSSKAKVKPSQIIPRP